MMGTPWCCFDTEVRIPALVDWQNRLGALMNVRSRVLLDASARKTRCFSSGPRRFLRRPFPAVLPSGNMAPAVYPAIAFDTATCTHPAIASHPVVSACSMSACPMPVADTLPVAYPVYPAYASVARCLLAAMYTLSIIYPTHAADTAISPYAMVSVDAMHTPYPLPGTDVFSAVYAVVVVVIRIVVTVRVPAIVLGRTVIDAWVIIGPVAVVGRR